MKIHKKIKIGIPIIGTFSAITSKVYIVNLKLKFGDYDEKKYYFRLSPGDAADENVIGIRAYAFYSVFELKRPKIKCKLFPGVGPNMELSLLQRKFRKSCQ